MSEPTIVIPISTFNGHEELFAKVVNLASGTNLLGDVKSKQAMYIEALRQKAEMFEGSAISSLVSLRSFGRDLQLILDEVNEEFERVKALRNLASDARATWAEGQQKLSAIADSDQLIGIFDDCIHNVEDI